MTARVTVRADLGSYVGGAGEETLTALVGERLARIVGRWRDHRAVLNDPCLISVEAMRAKLDTGTAFEILSIDVAIWRAESPKRDGPPE